VVSGAARKRCATTHRKYTAAEPTDRQTARTGAGCCRCRASFLGRIRRISDLQRIAAAARTNAAVSGV